MKKKITLNKEVVKYIFPGVHPEVAPGEDGYVIYNFDVLYPKKLAIFVPTEVEGTNYSNVFPKSFEDYFRDLDLEISRLSLLFEMGNIFNRFVKTEFIAGQIIKHEDGAYTIFRFDELVDLEQKLTLLCRTREEDATADLNTDVEYATRWDGKRYLYWFLPVEGLFKQKNEMTQGLIPATLISLCRQGK